MGCTRSQVYKKPSSVARAMTVKSPDIGRIVDALKRIPVKCHDDGDNDMIKEANQENCYTDLDQEWKIYDYDIENLVFSGGGIKGYSYIGALKVSAQNIPV